MRRDDVRPGTADQDGLARQVAALAAGLRDDGIAPARDLWPAIAGAIDAHRDAGSAPAARREPRHGRPWLTAALAATVLVMVGLGVTGPRTGRDAGPPAFAPDQPGSGISAGGGATPADGDEDARPGLRAVEDALAQLQTALKESPDDPDLSRLILLIHHSRGRLLRLQADDGIRNVLRPGA